MIQRIQSIFLLLAALCFFGLFGIPFASSDVVGAHFFADQVYDVTDHTILTVLAILGGVISLIGIFLYKNRSAQMRMGIFSIIASIFILVVAFLLVYNEADKLGDIEIYEKLGIGLPVLSILFVVLANRFIKKDDKLVKSMDRLR
jgi:hypothetical protein